MPGARLAAPWRARQPSVGERDRRRGRAVPAQGALVLLASLLLQVPLARAQTISDVCYHENAPNVGADEEIPDGATVHREINANQTMRFAYRNYDVDTMNKPDQFRKLILNLEPCSGVVYLFVRKTRRCYPDPYSCIKLTAGAELRDPGACKWTHFMSQIDGSRDGTPTFFEVPLSSTKFYISVFAVVKSSFTLTVLADTGAFPRPGNNGKITAKQIKELQVEITWDEAGFVPTGTTTMKQYWVYSSMLLATDRRQNMAVFMRPDKILNTVCGLINNTDRHFSAINAATCINGKCKAIIDPVITEKRYAFNVIAESNRGYRMAYAGLVMRTDWEIVRQAASDSTLRVIGAVAGSVLAMFVMIYLFLLKLYG